MPEEDSPFFFEILFPSLARESWSCCERQANLKTGSRCKCCREAALGTWGVAVLTTRCLKPFIMRRVCGGVQWQRRDCRVRCRLYDEWDLGEGWEIAAVVEI